MSRNPFSASDIRRGVKHVTRPPVRSWKQYPPDGPNRHTISFNTNARLWNWIDQTRGKKSRSRHIRDILTKVMENA